MMRYSLNLKPLKLIIFLFHLSLFGCAGEVDKCVKVGMDKFYADQKSGRHITDTIFKEDGSVLKKKKRTAEEHAKLMRNSCLKKRFKKD